MTEREKSIAQLALLNTASSEERQVNDKLVNDLKTALHQTYQAIGHDLAEARGGGLIPRDELVEVVLDQCGRTFPHVHRLSGEAKLFWSLMTDGEQEALAKKVFTAPWYE